MTVRCAATIKVIVVGNGQVGKSSMTTRYCKGYFTDTYKKTIGVDFMEKTLEVEEQGETVKLMVWDTAGQGKVPRGCCCGVPGMNHYGSLPPCRGCTTRLCPPDATLSARAPPMHA